MCRCENCGSQQILYFKLEIQGATSSSGDYAANCLFFNVSVDYLMNGEDTEYKAPVLEKDVRKFLLGKYNTDKNWELVKEYIKNIKSK